MLLAGKKALVTGSSRGIGRATALAFAREGADVAVHYRRQPEPARTVAAEIRAMGREALVIRAEWESAEEIGQLFDEIAERWQGLDIFMANAAASTFRPIMDLKPYHVQRTYRMLVENFILSAQRAVRLMEGREGRIITVTGHGSQFTLPRYGNIGSAKSAVESLTRYLAAELGHRHITVNGIAPGVVTTDSEEFYMGEKLEEFHRVCVQATPLERIGTPEEVADAAVFLASPLARFVTGQIIAVDGGLTLTSGPFQETFGSF